MSFPLGYSLLNYFIYLFTTYGTYGTYYGTRAYGTVAFLFRRRLGILAAQGEGL